VEARNREHLHSIPGVGESPTEVVLAKLGDVSRFRSAKQVVAYAGLAPGRRAVAGKTKDWDHQNGFGSVALGPGRGVLAVGAAVGALEACVMRT